MKRITINPITRLEGHGRIEIFLDESGKVANAYLQVPELRGFERFCVGRAAEEMPAITSRICGVCPEAHSMAAVKALDDLFRTPPTSTARKIRELLYSAFFVTDHTLHFYALGGPDFIVGPDAPPAERNILGVMRKVGLETGRKVIDCRARNHEVIQTLGGRGIHPIGGVPGGWSKPVSEEERRRIAEAARENVEFARFSLAVFDKLVLGNPAYVDLIRAETYRQTTYSMGTVNESGCLNFYDGKIRVVDPEGAEFARYDAREYTSHIAERVEPWSYMKFPYLKKVGWKGFVEGADSGVYSATPLSRLNVADRLATPLAQAEFERFYETLGSGKVNGRYRPVHLRLATHWARLIELLYAAERMAELANDPEITSPDIRSIPKGTAAGEGIGSVEAPRGTLTHHYTADDRGVLTAVNLVVGTTNNHAAISMSIRKAARELIDGRGADDALLNQVEMAFRLYDPCMSCATHSLGTTPLILTVRDARGEAVRTVRRDP
ncbi:MAG TPA: Ni/Fe hydrogenase subunit alpha [Bryobacteraceae bacterium]